jgi:hypothetical protein
MLQSFRMVGIPIPNVWLMARPLLPELIKAIRVTSRGVSPYFLARKHTRQPRGHANSRVRVSGEESSPVDESSILLLRSDAPSDLCSADVSPSLASGLLYRAATSEVVTVSAFQQHTFRAAQRE